MTVQAHVAIPPTRWCVDVNYSQLEKMRMKNTEGQSLSKNVGQLCSGGNVNDAEKTFLNLVTQEVVGELYMFCRFMEHRICSDVECCLAITVKDSRLRMRNTQITKEKTQPRKFATGAGHGPIFSFGRRARNNTLFLRSPGNERLTKQHTVADTERREFGQEAQSVYKMPVMWETMKREIIAPVQVPFW